MNIKKIATAAAALGMLISPLAAFADHSADDGTVSATVNIEARQEHRAEVKAQVGAKVEDNARNRANQEIERRVESLNKLIERINGAKRVGDKASITASLDLQIKALTDLKARIAADTSTTTLKADIQSITKSYRVFALVMPQAAITAAADRIKTVATQMQTLSLKLSARLDTLTSGGTDQSANIALMADANAKIADAKVQAQAALDLIANLKPDNGDAAVQASNTAALKAARDKIKAAQDDLKAAREDFRKVMVSIKGKGAATTTPQI